MNIAVRIFAVHEYFVDFYVQLSRNNLVKCREHWSHTCTDRKNELTHFWRLAICDAIDSRYKDSDWFLQSSVLINDGQRIRSGLTVWRSAAQTAASLTCTLVMILKKNQCCKTTWDKNIHKRHNARLHLNEIRMVGLKCFLYLTRGNHVTDIRLGSTFS